MKFVLTIITVLSLFAVGCSKKKSSSAAATAPGVVQASTYYLSGGICYTQTNATANSASCQSLTYHILNGRCYNRNNSTQQVDINNCTTGTYYFYNTQCYDRAGNIVGSNLCGSGVVNPYPTTPTYPTYPTGNQCYGEYWYYDNQYYDWWLVQCSGYDCAGYELLNAQTNQWVRCQ